MSGLSRFKASLRGLAASILYRTGVLGFLAARRLRRRAVVLTYHRVLPLAEIAQSPSHPGIIVSEETFRLQMRWLSREFRCLDLERFTDRLTGGGPFENRSCLVTFDDGWRDNYVHAYPVLRDCSMPATIFLAAGYIGSRRRFWQERLAELIRKVRRRGAASGELKELIGRCLDADEDDLREEISRVTADLKRRPPEEIDRLAFRLSELAGESAGGDDGDSHFLDWQQVRSMAGGGIAFGAHGMSHTILTRPEAEVERELTESKKLVEWETSRPVFAFCYPNGEYDSMIVRHVRESGFRVAFSTEPGYVSSGDDAYAVRRINVHEHMTRTIPLFLARIAGLW
jgi:peptidoglycan/xylan/chitin deacetylase (PgdA/CDA1 family)